VIPWFIAAHGGSRPRGSAMRRFASIPLVFALIGTACTGPGPGQNPDDGNDGEVPDCGAVVINALPEPGDDDFFAGSLLFVQFDRAPDTASLILTGPDGVVDGDVTATNGDRVHWLVPDEDLQPLSDYVLAVDWTPTTCGTLEIAFSTSAHGLPVDDADDLPSNTFELDLFSATIVQPPGVGPILQSLMVDTSILFRPLETSAPAEGELHVVGALGDLGDGTLRQDLCSESFPFTYGPDGLYGTPDDAPATWNDPMLELGPTDFDLVVQEVPFTIQELELRGTFHPDLRDLKGGTFEGLIDTRPLAVLIDPNAGPNAMCELMEDTIGVSCEECGGDSPGLFCLTLEARDVVATRIEGLSLVERTAADIAADPACAP